MKPADSFVINSRRVNILTHRGAFFCNELSSKLHNTSLMWLSRQRTRIVQNYNEPLIAPGRSKWRKPLSVTWRRRSAVLVYISHQNSLDWLIELPTQIDNTLTWSSFVSQTAVVIKSMQYLPGTQLSGLALLGKVKCINLPALLSVYVTVCTVSTWVLNFFERPRLK